MSDNPCNCLTCSKTFDECGLQKNHNPTPGHWYVGGMLRPAFNYTGCLSHTDARKYIMRGAIEELEDLVDGAESFDIAEAYREAILIVRGGKR